MHLSPLRSTSIRLALRSALKWALIGLPLLGPVAHAQSLLDSRQRHERSKGISMDEAVSRAESRYRAKAIKVERQQEGDRVIYQIRLLNAESKVFTVRVDAATGRMN